MSPMLEHDAHSASLAIKSQTTIQLRLIREAECRLITGLSRPQRWRLEQTGKFPERIRLSEKAHGWLESEVQEWIRQRIARRDARRK